MRIKLINKTKYSTADLRAFLRAGFRAYDVRTDKIVVVRYHRYLDRKANILVGVLGRGQLGSPKREAKHIWLNVPREHEVLTHGAPTERLSIGDLAHTLYHELLHNRGARHRDMTREQMYWDGVPAPWCIGLTIGLEPAKPGPSREERAARLVERREAHAREKLKEARTRLKRAKTIERIWHARVRYYERTAAKRKP